LENSGLYIIQTRDHEHVSVKERPTIREEPRTIDVPVANFMTPIRNYKNRASANRNAGKYTSPVLYKDGRSAFVRMVEKNISWRNDKSLKNYSDRQINQMLHLRGIEKALMEVIGDRLLFYQPETERLEESLREFRLHSVDLDYSHIGPGDPGHGFVEDRESIDYKLPEETQVIQPAARFRYLIHNPRLIARMFPEELGVN
tara:strand:- start:1378 stop:1980 length:603 start_codon:yes stop_codon:yes gene_type:complete